MRTYDIELVKAGLSELDDEVTNLNISDWLSNDSNIALTNENNDIALFESQVNNPGAVCGHYFFHSRGKAARIAAKDFLKEVFTGPYPIEVIIGLTPLDNKGALWMNKQLKFKSHGQIDTAIGPCEFVLLSKRDWELENNE